MTIEIGQLVSILGLLVSVGGSLYAWIASQGKAALPEIEGLRKEINNLRHEHSEATARVAKIEGELAHLPDKAALPEIEGLRKEINKLRHEHSEATARVAKIEGELAHLPDKDTVHKIELGLQAVQSRVEAQTSAMQEIRAMLERALSAPEPALVPSPAKPRRR